MPEKQPKTIEYSSSIQTTYHTHIALQDPDLKVLMARHDAVVAALQLQEWRSSWIFQEPDCWQVTINDSWSAG